MKEWYTAAQIARLKLPGLPSTRQGVEKHAKNEGWIAHATLCRARGGRGGGREFHYTLFPPAAIAALKLKAIKVGAKERPIDDTPIGLNGLQAERLDVRAAILAAFDAYAQGLSSRLAQDNFCRAYNARLITVADWAIEAAPKISERSLRRWLRLRKTAGEAALAGADCSAAQRGLSRIDADEEIKTFILGMLAQHPHVSNTGLLEGMTARFAPERIPHYRALARFTRAWRDANKAPHLALTNPDKFRSHNLAAVGDADANVHNVNALWELDSSPADVMLADGKRHAIVGVIDVYTRRLKYYVARTSSGAAVAHLLCTTMLAWGVPTKVKTDNGADYQSRQVVRMLAALQVKHHTCAPFSPHRKPFIERAFRTMSHDVLELAPGFVGHNVAERKDIEARKSFAQRMASDKPLIEIKMTADELQRHLDNWCDAIYAHRPHAGLNGKTPFEVFSAWQGAIASVPNARALEILAAFPIGFRVVGKKGLAVNGGIYNAVELGGLEGQRVFLRQNPEDVGKVLVFAADERTFICVAEDPAITGISVRDLAIARSQRQRRVIKEKVDGLKAAAKISRADRVFEDIQEHYRQKAANLVPFPKPSIVHDTPALNEAAKAAEELPPAPSEQASAASSATLTLRPNPANSDLSDEDEATYQAWRKATFGDAPLIMPKRRKAPGY